jgi:hypothetical protein
MPTNVKMVDDPDVKLPKAVRDASARADALFHALKDNPTPLDENGNPVVAEVTSEVTEEVPAELDPASLAAPAPEEDEQEEQQPQPTHAPVEDDGSWEHKYKSMHGRYNALQEQYRSVSDQVANLQNVIAAMQHVPSVGEIPPISTERLVTPEEENDYGKDLLTVVGKRAKEELAPLLTAQSRQIEQLTQTIKGMAGSAAKNTQAQMLATMDDKMPNWRDINTNQEFLSWLTLPDAYSGAIRHDMLKAAYAAGNATRVLAFFNGFLADEAVTAPVEKQPDPSRKVIPRIPLKNLAAPGKAKNAASSNGAPVEKPIVYRAQIAAFYADVAAGRYRGRDAEKDANEAIIFAAQADGRIR